MTAPMPFAATLHARAKINLALHVVGQRADGYHELESLVAFADVADRLEVEEGSEDELRVDGPFADGVPADGRNIVRLAVERLRTSGAVVPPLRIRLTKNLPHGAGIGGGSADAGAILEHLAVAGGTGRAHAREIAATLGADVPMCFDGCAAFVSGVGERMRPVAAMPELFALLVNPGRPVATPPVFAALREKRNAPLPPVPGDGFATPAALLAFLESTRNDLETPARAILPEIGDVLDAVAATAPLFRRMTGSGATVFALYGDAGGAEAAAAKLLSLRAHWWVAATRCAAVVDRGAVAA